jgi:uncharacterized membrane protein
MATPSRRPIPAWLSPAILACAGAYLASRWSDLPDRWLVHWGPGAIPNGWATRTPLDVYGLLLFALLLWGVLEAIVALAYAGGRAFPETLATAAATRAFMRSLSLGLSVLVAFLAIDLPLGHPQPERIVVLAVGCVSGAILVGLLLASLAFKQARRDGAPAPPRGYHGLHYSDPENPSLWVPKLVGVGYTLNFAHPWAWPMMGLILLLPLGAIVLALTLVAR